ncbi:MAG TPA: sigma-54 dependent transcriptional regulator [Phycisphaerae bacterium]|nr:sigma-54 dependent transcriptional regulator [Phycisphaerae bacterium]HNU44637.1 sigma-54 dependent transcriptional regulator [Phycisphaerae bacterium]
MVSAADKERILVVDDAPDTLELLRRNLLDAGYQVFTAPGAEEAIRLLSDTQIDLVITDLKMPHVSGLELTRHVRENLKDTEVMMITGYPTIQGAVTAVKLGVQDYITKPFTDEELLGAVQRILHVLRARRNAQNGSEQPLTLAGFIGESKAMRGVFQAIRKAAAVPATVLIAGESGTGKELAARAIHYGSPRAAAPFVPINCGSIPENLLESELFGHVKGAFTGATESRAGFFQTADGGTIFLDEISDTSLAMQAKLLRVLENGEIYMVGSARPRTVDVRVVAATNKDLRVLVKNGVFRDDLFFRLNVLTITMPPLRERENDVLLLVAHFGKKFAEELGRPVPQFTDDALRVLASYHWPGNVRELENAVQRVVVMTETNVIDVRDLPPPMRFSVGRDAGLHRTLAEVEAEHIRNVLASVSGNKTQAAELLGIDRKTLREKLKQYEGEAS